MNIVRYKMAMEDTREILRSLTGDEKGSTAVEYAIVGSLIAGIIVLAVTQLGINVSKLFAIKWW